MADSKIDWIGDMPRQWETRSVKSLFVIRKKISGELGYAVLSVTQRGIRIKNLGSNDGQQSNDYTKYQIVHKGDFVMNHMDLLTGYVDISQYEGVTSPDYRVFVSKGEICPRYALYLFQNAYKNKIFYGLGQGVSIFGRWRLPRQAFLEFEIPFPPLSDQERIAQYLDSECARIDRLLLLSNKKIMKLKELKQSIITKAVTEGLNSDIEMKDSGVEWIRKIPCDWEVIRIKSSCSLKGRIGWQGLKSDEFTDEGPFVITGVDFKEGSIDWENCNHFSMERFNEDSNIHVIEGDLLITKDGTIGKVALATDCPDFVSLNSGVMIVRPLIDLNQRFLYYVLTSSVFWLWYESNQRGNSTIRHLYQEQFGDFKFPLPSASQQSEIVSYLDEKCSNIDQQIQLEKRRISLFDEYEQSLIYELVTGKKEVPQ